MLNMLKELKAYLHVLHDHDDANLSRLLEEGTAVVQGYCGSFDIEEDLIAKSLVFNYVRFAYNGMQEHFYNVYKVQLSAHGFHLMEGDAYDV